MKKAFIILIAFLLLSGGIGFSQISKQIKLTSAGNVIEYHSAQIVEDQNILLYGQLSATGVYKNVLIKLDALSNVLWSKGMINNTSVNGYVNSVAYQATKTEIDQSTSYYFTLNPNATDTTLNCSLLKQSETGSILQARKMYTDFEFYLLRSAMRFNTPDSFLLATYNDRGTILFEITDSTNTNDTTTALHYKPIHANLPNYYFDYSSGQVKLTNGGEVFILDNYFKSVTLDTSIISLSFLDSNYNLNWSKLYKFNEQIAIRGLKWDEAHQNLYVLGQLAFYSIPNTSIQPQYTAFILKINQNGDVLWLKKYYTNLFENMETFKLFDIVFSNTSDTLYVGGEFRQLFGETQPVLVKMDTNGQIIESIYYAQHDEFIDNGGHLIDGSLVNKSDDHLLWTSPYYYTRLKLDTLERACSLEDIVIMQDTTSILFETRDTILVADTIPIYTSNAVYNFTNLSTQVVDKCLGIGINENIDDNLSLFPNPTSGYLNIECNDDQIVGRIMDVKGRYVLNYFHGKHLDLTSLMPGIYIIEITIPTNPTPVFRKILKI